MIDYRVSQIMLMCHSKTVCIAVQDQASSMSCHVANTGTVPFALLLHACDTQAVPCCDYAHQM